ncbi:1-acyl-sn-glycerol-3-phosphate acyltransferase [Actinacidiphila acididurans]|uniref:1-acyl-sn-glycerol-3-phosphate acyltransferase n=1 Tax=Actinacidiphila acididurans TaxID=2784346 RepID=A0ABS2U394_9ACTN|nr:1-acyl-sn-glycerol-3-phosphate acyltransferase [Actinacidiphila acididurans]MBM9510073.1 1-acyl-sn-glycerol-3-phosphate acyltransferase [Actinacidiphila acididurans]
MTAPGTPPDTPAPAPDGGAPDGSVRGGAAPNSQAPNDSALNGSASNDPVPNSPASGSPGRNGPALTGPLRDGLVAALRRTLTTALLLALIPVTAAVFVAVTVLGAPVSLLTGGPWRPARIAGFTLVYLVTDLAGLVAAAALWVRHPASRPARAVVAFRLLARLLLFLRRTAERVFGLELDVSPAIPRGERPDAPVLVFVRHAGPGDSFLLLQTLLTEAGLLPHTVLKGALRADPCLDVLVSTVPHCFLPPARGTAQEGIAELAAGLRAGEALVLFPEGGNFTPRRHRRAIASLRRRGLFRRAAKASRLRHVLPPRDAGALAALEAAPTADVVFVTHSGLEVIDSARSAWAALPFDHPVRAHWWHVPAAAIPAGREARSEWLLDQWARVDGWIAGHAVPGTPHA